MTGQRTRRCIIVHPGAELYGSDRVMLESAAALVGSGWQVLAILPQDGPLVADLRAAGVGVRIAPQLVLRKSLLRPVGLLALPFLALAALVRAAALLVRARPDAVYVSTITLPVWPLAARLCRVPSVVHVHEAEENARSVVKRLLYAPVGLATKVIANSSFSQGVMADADAGLAARTDIVYNGVLGPAAVTAARPSLDGGPRIVFVGRLSPRKGADLVVDAVVDLRERGLTSRLVLLGSVFPGYEWYDQQLRTAIQENGLEDVVELSGFIPDIWPELAEADIVVVPSRFDEPFGNTAVEAALAARPLVVSDTSGLREATAGLQASHRVAPDDAVAIADAIAEICDSWESQRLLAEDDAATCRARFSPERYRADISAILDDLSSARPSRTRRGTT